MLVSPGGYAVPTPNTSQSFYESLFHRYKGRFAGYEVRAAMPASSARGGL